jgi:phospholipase/carboxylesterase
LRRTPPIAALVGFSGLLIAPEILKEEIKAKPPVCLIHGQMDDVVPYASLKQAGDALSQAGIAVETHTRPGLGHSIDLEGIQTATHFLKKAF